MSFEGTQYGHGRRSELVSAACKNPSQTETLEQRIDMLQTLPSFHFDFLNRGHDIYMSCSLCWRVCLLVFFSYCVG